MASSSSYEKYTPTAYTVSSLNIKFRMESFLWRNDPRQSISHLDWFICKTEQFSNCRSRSKSLWTDRISFTKTVVSSAYWIIFYRFIWISFPISFERLTALLRISTPIKKRDPRKWAKHNLMFKTQPDIKVKCDHRSKFSNFCDDHTSLSSTTAVQLSVISYIFHMISLQGKIWTQ